MVEQTTSRREFNLVGRERGGGVGSDAGAGADPGTLRRGAAAAAGFSARCRVCARETSSASELPLTAILREYDNADCENSRLFVIKNNTQNFNEFH